jgi:transcriptional regulator NrdR family protein
MNCPLCKAWSTVLETRTRQDNTRRRTLECGNLHKFTTVERVEAAEHGGARFKMEKLSGKKNNN